MCSLSRRFQTPPAAREGLSRLRSRVRAPSAPPLNDSRALVLPVLFAFSKAGSNTRPGGAGARASLGERSPRLKDSRKPWPARSAVCPQGGGHGCSSPVGPAIFF
jgi:hypothetical protein